MENEWTLIGRTHAAEETKALAAALAPLLAAGDAVLLTGDLGAGKTQFVQGLAAGLGATETVISPTFNIVLTYLSGRLPLHHFDLYRLDEYEQLSDIALREYLESDGVCLVEWAEKFPQAFDGYLAVRIDKAGESDRAIRAHASGPRGCKLLELWTAECDAPCAQSGGATCESASGSKGVVFGETASSCEGEQHGDASCTGGDSGHETRNASKNNDAMQDHVQIDAYGQANQARPEAQGGSGLTRDHVLAFDTANEVVAVAVGKLDPSTRTVDLVAAREANAHRVSNTTLVPTIDELLGACGIGRAQIACVCVGRGPGSFTGVRIAMATAKGIAQALGIGLVGVSTLDAVAWAVQMEGCRGSLLVAADAMRKEVYPVRYALFEDGARRLSADRVVKADTLAGELADECSCAAECAAGSAADLLIVGDGLAKYKALYEPYARIVSEELWNVTGRGLLASLQDAWRRGEADPFDAQRHNPAFALPVYTRLSDAEENERARLASTDPKNLRTGVQDAPAPDGGIGRATMHAAARLAPASTDSVTFMPLDSTHAADVAALEARVMGSDAWNERMVADELGKRDRSWWIALCDDESDGVLRFAGYAGGMVVDGDLQVLRIAVDPDLRRHGIARELISRVAEDARNLGARTCSLEVRAGNTGAQAFYRALGFESIGVRPRYYSDREDAVIMQGALPVAVHDVAGMELKHLDGGRSAGGCGGSQLSEQSLLADTRCGTRSKGAAAVSDNESRADAARPLILAIESSCDETAAAVVDGDGNLLSDVVASQVDFHARFGGVVPEIASRKHIEAICGVCSEALEGAIVASKRGEALALDAVPDTKKGVTWDDLDAVAVTYAPGLLGALVVGVAYAKGAAWALSVPLIGVNHLEGHLYANKIGAPDFAPPAVVSLVSGGNTMLVHMRDWGSYETLGATIDDAVGEAFDKVSKALGLGYPGGPIISKYAGQGNPAAIAFPRALMHSHDMRFSLSGLKTAVVNYINGERQAGRELNIPDIAASFQQAVVDVQVAKTRMALEKTGAPTFCVGGGVAANPALRAAYEKLCAEEGIRLVMPPISSCGDNAGMIALVALDRYRQKRFFSLDADAYAHADLDETY